MTVSPSQIETAIQCLRKWGWQKLEGRECASSPSAELGDAVHQKLEHYLKTGDLDTTDLPGQIASRGLPYLPTPHNTRHRIERWLSVYTDGVPWTGRKDLEYQLASGQWIVHDHKTTRHMARAKKQEELLSDCQALVYAYDTMNRESVDTVRCDWMYLHTKSTASKLVSVELTREHVAEAIKPYVEFGRALEDCKRVYKEQHKEGHQGPRLRVLDLPPDPSACEAFGGCPFIQLCDLSLQDHLDYSEIARGKKKGKLKTMDEKLQALMARLKAATGQPVQEPTTAPVTPPPAAPVTEAPSLAAPALLSVLGSIQAEQDAKSAEVPAPSPAPVDASPIVPEPLPGAPEQPKPPPAEETPKQEKKPRAKKVQKEETPPAAAEPAAPPSAASASPSSGYVLCVNCLPVGVPFTYLYDWLQPILVKVHQAENVPHYKLIEYGKGPAVLQGAVQRALDSEPPTGYLVLETKSAEGADLLGTMTAKAGVVIRGVF